MTSNNRRPCAFSIRDETTGEESLQKKAAVYCSFHCDECGFNPEEARRRMTEGEFVAFPDGTRRLIFRKKEQQHDPTS